MFKHRIMSFCVGGAISRIFLFLWSDFFGNPEEYIVAFIHVLFLLGLYYVLNDYLVYKSWIVRKIFAPRMAAVEGYWAQKLDHPTYHLSLGRIYYNVVYDKYVYEGWAFKDLSSNVVDGDWQSHLFFYDNERSKFIFACKGSATDQSVESTFNVDSFGELIKRSTSKVSYLEGNGVDLGRKNQEAREPIKFHMRLFRVKRNATKQLSLYEKKELVREMLRLDEALLNKPFV